STVLLVGVIIFDRLVSFKKLEKLKILLYAIPYIVIGYDVIRKAFKGIIHLQAFDECLLMTIATIGAVAMGEYTDGVAVMILYQTGELFQSIAVGKSRKNITALMDIRSDYANLVSDGKTEKVDPDSVAVGSEIAVFPGEKVPIDGIITKGRSALDNSALTGESVPMDVKEGDTVLSGAINLNGVLYLTTTKEFGSSTASKILETVENASSKKSKSENFISKFARVYTPAVVISALCLGIFPPVIRLIGGYSPLWKSWIYRALTFLIVSCPCALVISIPLSFFAGLGGASKEGILIKGSSYLETLSKIKYLLFDKTGTITKGVFKVVGVHHSPILEKEVLFYAAHAENYSSHPIAKSIVNAYGKPIDESIVQSVKEISGNGVTAIVNGKNIACGNDKLMKLLCIEYLPCHSAGTIVHVVVDGTYCGHILISDVIKEESKSALEKLKKDGLKKTIMLTGDNRSSAEQVAKKVGVDEFYAGLLPADKVRITEEVLAKAKGDKVAFVGDGINDAPVLARADLGIAMGALGSDAAIEAADVVLMDDNLLKIPKAIKIAKKCMRIVYENIIFALGVKFACLILSALGIANMWLAIFADVGVMILAVLNAIRCLNVKKL
ncbi:MAG TPA: cadmium-translocating P-type ATPase, partial [Clostridiales bacterium]|nr:cadmium-translocating P-type ATPase [Clostridiales bacterium]